jgi:hypothetical protein
VAAEKRGLIDEPREEQVMFKRNLGITVFVVIGLSIAAVVSAGMHFQRKGMSCMSDMMGMGGKAWEPWRAWTKHRRRSSP